MWSPSPACAISARPSSSPGRALGLPALTFRAYYQARFGEESWPGLNRIPRSLWMEYLIWYRQVARSAGAK